MINLLHLNKLKLITIFFIFLIFDLSYAATSVDIWEKQENQETQNNEISDEDKIKIESPILSDDTSEEIIKINESELKKSNNTVVGIFDPEENDFNLNMWQMSDGEDVKNVLKRINKLKLSKFSEDLLFKVLFTNAYPPNKNLSSNEFLKIKIDWLIKNRSHQDLEILLQINPEVGQEPKTIKLLINEYLSSANIKSACEKVNFMSKDLKNKYLDKFKIYCLINDDRKEEAQLVLDLLKEQ